MDISGDKLAKSYTRWPGHSYERETSRETGYLIGARNNAIGSIILEQKSIIHKIIASIGFAVIKTKLLMI